MWCVNIRLAQSQVSQISVPFKRGYKKVPYSYEQIKAAQQKQDNQKRKMIENYHKKYEQENSKYQKFLKLNSIAESVQKKIPRKSTKKRKMPPNVSVWRNYARNLMEDHYNHYDVGPELTYRTIQFIKFLNKDDPYYWNPIRLGNLFDCDAVTVRGIIWEQKLALEAEKAGDMLHCSEIFSIPWQMLSKEEIKLAQKNKIPWEIDEELGNASVPNKQCYAGKKVAEINPDEKEENNNIEYVSLPILKDRDWTREFGVKDVEEKIRYAHGKSLGEKDFGKDFKMWPPRERMVNDKRNTWHYIPSGANSKELLTFIRSYYARKRIESPRIPPRQVVPPVPLKEHFASGAHSKGTLPGKRIKTLLVDASPCYDMYNRPMKVRDENNEWRTPTYDERRAFQDQFRDIKLPPQAEDMIIYPDEQQPDHMAVSHKPPDWYLYRFNEGDQDILCDIDNPYAVRERMKMKPLVRDFEMDEFVRYKKRQMEMESEKKRGGDLKNVVVSSKRMRMMHHYSVLRKQREEMKERNRYDHGATKPEEMLGVREDNPWFTRWWNHIDTKF